MAEEKKTLAVRAPRDWYDEVDDHAEERGISKSDVLRRATKAYLDDKSNNSVSRAASPLALLGVICLAVAPTLLATGHVLVGGLAGLVAAAYVLLWVTATDVLVEEALGTAREELQAVGGVLRRAPPRGLRARHARRRVRPPRPRGRRPGRRVTSLLALTAIRVVPDTMPI